MADLLERDETVPTLIDERAVLSRHQRTLWQLAKYFREFTVSKDAIARVVIRKRLIFWKKADRTGAFTAYLLKHREIIPVADTENAGDDFAVTLLRQRAAEKAPALVLRKGLCTQWQRARQRERARL